MLGYSLSLRQIPMLQQSTILSLQPRFASIFPRTETIIAKMSRKKKTEIESFLSEDSEEYESWMDLLFVSFFPTFKTECMMFYKNEGKPLRRLISTEESTAIDDYMAETLLMYLRDVDWVVNDFSIGEVSNAQSN